MIEPGTVNPGTRTLEGTTEQAALANIGLFAAAVRERGGLLDGDPVRDPAADAATASSSARPPAPSNDPLRSRWTAPSDGR